MGHRAGRRCVLALLLVLSGATAAAAEVRVQVLETDPPSPATLGHWEPFHLRIGYDSDRTIRVRGDAFFQGKRVTSISSGSPRYEPGTGEAYVWLAYTDAARVDKVVIFAKDDVTRNPLAQAEIAVDLTWTGIKQPEGTRARAGWVERLQAETERRSKAESAAYMNRPLPWWEGVLSFAMAWSVPGYLVLQVVLLRRYRGRWRLAAAVPALPMAVVLVYTVYAFRAGSNLFPLGLIFTSPFALLYLIGVIVVRRVLLRKQREISSSTGGP
jgi:hypothetical protein